MPRRIAPSGAPWILAGASDPSDVLSPGGIVRIFTAAAALLIGDCVFMSANGTVDKTATTGTHVRAVGIVVGGTATGMTCSDDPADFNVVQAAAANDRVIVLIQGVSFVIADAAMATVGTPLAPSTTVAGRVRPAVLGTGADDGKHIGKILETAAGVASIVRALITVA